MAVFRKVATMIRAAETKTPGEDGTRWVKTTGATWGERYGRSDLHHADGEYTKEGIEKKEGATEGYSAELSPIADILSTAGSPRLMPSDEIRPGSHPPRLGQTPAVSAQDEVPPDVASKAPHPSPLVEKPPAYSPPTPPVTDAAIEPSDAAVAEPKYPGDQAVVRNMPSVSETPSRGDSTR